LIFRYLKTGANFCVNCVKIRVKILREFFEKAVYKAKNGNFPIGLTGTNLV